jgi:hypothetical protein
MDNANAPTADNFSSSNVPLHPYLYGVFAYESSDSINRGFNNSYWVYISPFGESSGEVIASSSETIAPLAIADGRSVTNATGVSYPGALTGSNMAKNWGTVYAHQYVPAYTMKDLFRGLTSIPDGIVQVAEMADYYTTTTSDLDATTSYTSVTVTDASIFPAGGGNFFINGEPWSYASKSSNTLNGVTRGLYGRAQRKSKAGDKVFLGKWFMKYNYAAIPVGYTSPI